MRVGTHLASPSGVGLNYFGSLDCGLDRTLRPDDETNTIADTEPLGRLTRLTTHDGGEDRYIVDGEIARGGQAAIFRAHDCRLHRTVAIKQLTKRSKAAEIRFVNEALITARLSHPSIVPIYDVGHWADGTPYFSMKLVEGQTLAARIREAKTPAVRMALMNVVVDVAEAMAYAHQQRIVHRDLKPSNILVSDHGQTMVIDWGIAKLLNEKLATSVPMAVGIALTARGSVLGTPGFMSPEQAFGECNDARSDVYSLGALMYLVLAGEAPFAGLSAIEIVEANRSGDAAMTLRERAPDLDPCIVGIVDRAMSLDPDDRFDDAAALLEAWRAVMLPSTFQQVG